MSSTPPISGSTIAPGASAAHLGRSPSADLLAASPANAAQGFKAIAAKFFHRATSAPNQTHDFPRGSTAATRNRPGRTEPETGNRQAGTHKPESHKPGSHKPETLKTDTRKTPETPDQAAVRALPAELPAPPDKPLQPEIQLAPAPLSPSGSEVASSTAATASFWDPQQSVSRLAAPSLLQAGDGKDAVKTDGNGGEALPSFVRGSAPPEDGKSLLQPPATGAPRKPKEESAAPVDPGPRGEVPASRDPEAAKAAVDRPAAPDTSVPARKDVSTEAPNLKPHALQASPGNAVDPAPLVVAVENGSLPLNPIPAWPRAAQEKPATGTLKPDDVGSLSVSLSAGVAARFDRTPSLARAAASAPIKGRSGKDAATATLENTPVEDKIGASADGSARLMVESSKDASGLVLQAPADLPVRTPSSRQGGDTPSSPTALVETEAPDEALPASTLSPVTAASLIRGISQSEFRVGMQSRDFGSIDIRTSVTRHLFSAQISVEHGDVAKSLAMELPDLYVRLAEQQVGAASVVIQGQGPATSSGSPGDTQPRHSQPQSPSGAKSDSGSMLPVVAEGFAPAGRLDIRI